MNDLFDDIVRDKLINVRVKPPKRVWRGVSAQLHGRNAFQPFWAIAGVGCAFALFFALVPSHTSSTPSSIQEVCVVVDNNTSHTLAFESEAFSSEIVSLRSDFIPRQFVDNALMVKPKVEEEGNVGLKEAPKKVTKSVADAQEWEDPFAVMVSEDNKPLKPKREKISLKVGGAIGANDSHSGGVSTHPMWSSGHVYEGVNEESSVSSFSVPVSAGLSVCLPLTDRLSIGSGLNWTLLNRSFKGSYNTVEGDVTHDVQYIGIPLALYFDIVKSNRLRLYSFAGASVEKCISSKYYILSESSLPLINEKVKDFQAGFKLGIGGSFNISSLISIYFDPFVSYYIPGNQPKSLRTEYPLMVSFEAGLRFNL